MIIAATVVSFLILLLHIFGGGPSVAGPLLRANDIHDVPKYVNYYCWHLVTIVLFAMTFSWGWYWFDPTAKSVAILSTGLAIAFMVWGFGLVVWKKQKHLQMPQWILFLVATIVYVGALW